MQTTKPPFTVNVQSQNGFPLQNPCKSIPNNCQALANLAYTLSIRPFPPEPSYTRCQFGQMASECLVGNCVANIMENHSVLLVALA